MFKPVLHRIAAFLEVTRWIIIILAALIMGLYFYLHRKDADHATIAPLPHTDWVVYGYPGHDEGWINTVIARNEKTGENIRVATISEDANIWFDESDTLVIAVARTKYMTRMRDSFAGHPVVYQFWAEDASQQASYQFWVHHRKDPVANEWCQKNMGNPENICKTQ